MFFSILLHIRSIANDLKGFKYGHIDFKKKSLIRLVRRNRKIYEFPIADVLINMINRKAYEDTPLFTTLISK